MRRPLAPLARRPLLLAIIAAILAISVVYSASVRRAFLLTDLQFIPVEDELLVVTGDVESLWEAVDHHFREVLLDEEEEEGEVGLLTEGFRDLREDYREGDLRVEGLADLVEHGFDIRRGLLMSVDFPGPSEPSVLVVLPVTGEGAVTEVVSEMMGDEPDDEPSDLGLGDVPVVSYGATPDRLTVDGLLAYPGDGRALFGNDRSHFLRGILNRDRNRAHAYADDELYRVVREGLQGSLGSGPTLFGWWRPLGVPGIERLAGMMTLHPDAVRLGVEVKAHAGVLGVLDDFLVPAEMGDDWHRLLGPETAAALVVEDEALSDHLGFLRRFETIRNFLDEGYGGVLSTLDRLPGLHRVLLAVTGYRDGLPEVVLGVWGDPDSLRDLVTDVQLRRRQERDSAVLQGAVEAFLEQQAEGAEDPVQLGQITVQVLEEAGVLVPEEGSTFHRYTIRSAQGSVEPPFVVDPDTLVPEDLISAAHVTRHGSATIRFVLPPVTDNDVAYIPGLAEVDGEALRGDRYRLATVVLDSMLWVATDVMDARKHIDRAAAGPGEYLPDLSESGAFQTAQASWSRSDRIQGFLDIDRLGTLGLLSPESDVEEGAKRMLLDFRNHPSVSLAVRSEDTPDRVLVELTAFLQRGLRDR